VSSSMNLMQASADKQYRHGDQQLFQDDANSQGLLAAASGRLCLNTATSSETVEPSRT
jgi:hypothetical protein